MQSEIEKGILSRSLNVTDVSHNSKTVTSFYATDGAGLNVTIVYEVGDLDIRSIQVMDNNSHLENNADKTFIDGEDMAAITGELLDIIIENAEE